jgi:hypothetical protein
MKSHADRLVGRGLASLRNFVRKTPETERCELCTLELRERHQHLVDPKTRRLLCACDACAMLFSAGGDTKYRRVPRDARALIDFQLSDQAWNGMAIPIGLAFIYLSSVSNQILGVYPSPAGPTEAEIDKNSWEDLLADNPALAKMNPDVEALLINRMSGARQYFLAPIDECYKLTGLVRKYWRGFSGGDEGWEQIEKFFEQLKKHSYPEAVNGHARSFV